MKKAAQSPGEKKRRVNRGLISEINLSALEHNLKVIRRVAESRTLIGVVKADAYGHGAVRISKKLISLGVSQLAVAYTGEGRVLREAGIDSRIIVLFDRSEISDYLAYDLMPVICSTETAIALSKEAKKRGKNVSVHLKIDSGMGRMGFLPEAAVEAAVLISGLEGIRIEGLLSHFSEADSDDHSFSFRQLEIFSKARHAIEEKTGLKLIAHMASSAAILSMKESLLDAVRPGLALYGCSPLREKNELKPVMKLSTRILSIRKVHSGTPISYGRSFVTERESKIAVLPLGYADGYSRLFSNNAEVLVHGVRAPVRGRVCMDLTMIDVTHIRDVSEGDEAVLLGGQEGDMITAAELSARIHTVPYEILTSLGARAAKEYVQ
jgi:alanine racemase